jgi:hypothetical protein
VWLDISHGSYVSGFDDAELVEGLRWLKGEMTRKDI